MIKRWLCLLLVSAFLLQSAVAGVQSHVADPAKADHQSATVGMDHVQHGTDQNAPECDMQQHGHCCHGHCCHGHLGAALLTGHAFNFYSINNRPAVDYTFFIPSSPSSELLRPPAV